MVWQTVYRDQLAGRPLQVSRSSDGSYRLVVGWRLSPQAEGDAALGAQASVHGEALNRSGLVEALLALGFSPVEAAQVLRATREQEREFAC